MSWDQFLQAIHTADYEESTRILSESLKYDMITEFADKILIEIEVQNHRPLPFRDHIFKFLDISSLFHCLNISGTRILKDFSSFNSLDTLRKQVQAWVVDVISQNQSSFLLFALEIDDISNTDYVTLIPDILNRRLHEFDILQIPYAVSGRKADYRIRYYIEPLWRSAYGRQLLNALGISPDNIIVGETSWSSISQAISALGYDIESMLLRAKNADWLEVTRNGRSTKPTIGDEFSRELTALWKCQDAYLQLDSPERGQRLHALDLIISLGTRACNRKVTLLAQDGSVAEQRRAIQIMADTGNSFEENILSSLLNTEKGEIRNFIARALSKMASRTLSTTSIDSVSPSKEQIKLDTAVNPAHFDISTFDILLKSRNSSARIDAANALALMNTPEAEQLLYKLSRDSDPRVRIKVVNLIPSVSRELATSIMHDAIKDNSRPVRERAIMLGKQIWPEQDWPEI